MKNKNMKKALLIATSVALVAPIVVANSTDVEASTVKLSEKKQGDIIKLGGVDYVVISQKYGGVLVQSKDVVKPYATYDLYNNNVFDINDPTNINIGSYLNNVYYNELPEDVKKLIKTVDWHVGDEKNESSKTVSAKIGLLTENDWKKAGKYYGGKIESSQEGLEWLMTPVAGNPNAVWSVRSTGDLNPYIHAQNEIATKASFVLDLDLNVDSDGNVSEPEKPSIVGPSEPSIDIDFDNTGDTSNGSNGSIDLDDYFNNTSPGDVIFTPNVLVNEAQADVSVVKSSLMIKNAKKDGLVSVNVEAENSKGEKAQALFNLYVKADDNNNGSGDSDNLQDKKATIKLVEGEFTLKTSDINDFGKIKLTAAKQTVTTDFAGDFGVIDARGTQEGWNVTVSATPFTVETFEGFVGTPHQLPLGSLALNNPLNIERINHINTTDGLPTTGLNGYNILDNGAVPLLNANQGEGLGEFKFNFEDALALTVDAVTAKIDTVNYPEQDTPYASTVTWDLVSGPQL